MVSQAEKGRILRALHDRDRAFIIPNPWDRGSARLLDQRGFEALATTSAGCAFALGRRDNTVGRDLMMAHVAAIADATDLPVSADLENGYGDGVDAVAETIGRVAAAGAVGGSIEDATGRSDAPLYELAHAADRIAAAAHTARSLKVPFTLTARAENYLVGKPDLADTITRLQAYQAAGADVLFAPGLTSAADIATLVRALDRPVNVLAGLGGATSSLAELSALGVRRVSVGSLLSRVALGALLRAAAEMHESGTFSFSDDAVSYRELSDRFDLGR
jgi:2-methylisocitrate lyase-like PEP mutase family enzyme